MTTCPKCKAAADDGDRFCNQCGARLEESSADEAAGQTQKSLKLSDVHYNLGLVYYKKEEFDKALEAWERGLQQDPDNPFLRKSVDDLKARLAGGA